MYTRHLRYDEAENWVKRALGFYLETNDTYGLYASYNALGRINYGRGNHDVALSYYEKSMETSLKRNDQYSVAVELNNIGIILLEKGQMQKAYEHLASAMKTAEEMKTLYLQRIICESFNDYYFVARISGKLPITVTGTDPCSIPSTMKTLPLKWLTCR
jgi:tetratricopeptide (TPR) repeat protein